MMHTPLKERALGRWPGILAALGVSVEGTPQQAWPLPDLRRQGSLSFRRQGRQGHMDLQPVRRRRRHRTGPSGSLGVEFREAARAIRAAYRCGSGNLPRLSERTEEQTACGKCCDMWKRSRSIASDDAVGLYLRKRLGLTIVSARSALLPR